MHLSLNVLAMLVWLALLIGFVAGCFWAGRPRDPDPPEAP